jgi:chorismate dehydratase
LENKYKYVYDLAEEWQKFTGLPFVFACWTANKQLPQRFIEEFNAALKDGLGKLNELIPMLEKEGQYATDIDHYLRKSISYDYDAAKKQALELFLSYLSKLGQ